jgi:hypothetical protein
MLITFNLNQYGVILLFCEEICRFRTYYFVRILFHLYYILFVAFCNNMQKCNKKIIFVQSLTHRFCEMLISADLLTAEEGPVAQVMNILTDCVTKSRHLS